MNAPFCRGGELCICSVCSLKTAPSSPSAQSAVSPQVVLEAQQLAAQYQQLDDYGRRVAKAIMASLLKLGPR